MFIDIKCPACEVGQIKLQPHMLMQGKSFSCNCCDATVGVANSSLSTLENGLTEFDNLKAKVASMKAEGAQLN